MNKQKKYTDQKLILAPKNIQEIKHNRLVIIKKRLKKTCYSTQPLDEFLLQPIWSDVLSQLKDPHIACILPGYRQYTHHNYSLVGIATIALKTRLSSDKEKLEYLLLLHSNKKPKGVSFKEKKEFIQELFTLGFQPNEKDKKFALLITYEEFGRSLIPKKWLLQKSLLLDAYEVLPEIRDYIALLMFETELLF